MMTKKPRRKAAGAAQYGSRNSPPDNDQLSVDRSQDTHILKLRSELDRLNQAVMGLAGLSSMDNVVGNGFEMLMTQLQPLQDLTPPRRRLDDAQNGQLTALRASAARPEWRSAGSLSIPEKRVPFIFERDPASLPAPDTPSYQNLGRGRQ
jgi:hypothetical protein